MGIKVGRLYERRNHVIEDMIREAKRLDDLAKDFPHRLTFICDICHKDRNNALINVVKYKDDTGTIVINIKYCHDRIDCKEKAHQLDMWHGTKVYPLKEDEDKDEPMFHSPIAIFD